MYHRPTVPCIAVALTIDELATYVAGMTTVGAFSGRPVDAGTIRHAMGSVRDLSYRPAWRSGTTAGAYVDAILTDFSGLQTVLAPFPLVFIGWQWLTYIETAPYYGGNWPDCLKGMAVPAAPPAWRDAHLSARKVPPSQKPDGSMIYTPWGGDRQGQRAQSYMQARFSPSTWTDVERVSSSLSRWQSVQLQQLDALAGRPLDSLAALQLLLVLASLCNATDPATRARVATILVLGVDSPHYPNDTMARQLVYFALIALVDPRGAFVMTNAEIRPLVDRIAASLVTIGAGTDALRQALGDQSKILKVSPSYPMLDPYVLVGFSVRQADTLAAINAAWENANA